jgi:hypothetical protein
MAEDVPMGAPVLAHQDSQDESVQRTTLSAAQLAEIDFSDEFMAQVRMFEAAFQGHWAYVKAYLNHNREWVGIENPLGSRAGYKLVHQVVSDPNSQPISPQITSASSSSSSRQFANSSCRPRRHIMEAAFRCC